MTVVIQDGFSGTNGDSLSGRTPDTTNNGNTWTVVSGTWQIQSNQARKTANGATVQFCVIDVTDADLTLDAKITCAASEYAGQVVRYVDASNLVYVQFVTDGGANTVTILERVSGSNTSRGSRSIGTILNTQRSVTVELSGSSITVTVPSYDPLTYASLSNTTATKAGIWGYATGTDHDDFTVDVTAGGTTVSVSATLTAVTSTSDTVDLDTSGAVALSATLTAQTSTSDTVFLAILRNYQAALTAESSTSDTVELDILRNYQAILTAQSSTSDTVSLDILQNYQATLTAETATSDTVSLDVETLQALVATLTAQSATSDTVTLDILRNYAATLTAQSETSDTVELLVVGAQALAATLTAVSSTSASCC